MNKRRRLLLRLTLALGLVGLTIYFIPAHEPSQNGKRLSEWLDVLVASNGEPAAVAAVRAIGTNAVPHLLRRFSFRYSRRREAFYTEMSRLLHGTLHLKKQPIYDPTAIRFIGALRGFEALGPIASNAVPHLRKLLDTPGATGQGAGIAMSYIGPRALPALIDGLANDSPVVRYHALRGVAPLGTNAAAALPALLNCLNDTNSAEVRPFAVSRFLRWVRCIERQSAGCRS